MKTSDKLKAIKPFVKIKIPKNKKMFTSAEKSLITRYFNALDSQGYFNDDNDGYILTSIAAKTAPKIKGLPKVTKKFVEVGTVIKNGKLITNPNRSVKLKNGKLYVIDKKGAPRIWRFDYNIAKNWKEKEFAKYLRKQIGEKNLKKTQFFAIGAGIKYQVRNSISDSLNNLARQILKIGYGYTPSLTQKYEDRGQTKYLKDWLQEIVVYENFDDVASKLKNVKYKKKRRKKKL